MMFNGTFSGGGDGFVYYPPIVRNATLSPQPTSAAEIHQIWFCVSESSRYVRFMYETVLHKPEVLDGLAPEVLAGRVCYNCGALRSEEEDEEPDDK